MPSAAQQSRLLGASPAAPNPTAAPPIWQASPAMFSESAGQPADSASSQARSDATISAAGAANATYATDALLTEPVEVLSADNNYFLKVNLRDSRVRFRVALANNDSGGRQPLYGIKSRFENQGYVSWAIVNGDLFSGGCPDGVNCAQGLTYIDGVRRDNWSAYGNTWMVRGNLGLDASNNASISVGDGQTRRSMTIGGGPRVLMGGGNPTCNPQYNSGTGKTYFPDSGEYFDGDASYWCTDTRAMTMLGYSADGQFLYMGISKGGRTVTQLAQWLKDRGAHEILRLDSGGSSQMYHNGTYISGTGSDYNRALADAFVLTVDNEPPPPPPAGWERDSNCGSSGVTLYEHSNYGGACLHTSGIAYSRRLTDYNFNDIASSVKIVGNWVLYLAEHDDRGGAMKQVTQDVPNLASWTFDNTASSAEVQAPGICKRLNTSVGPAGAGGININTSQNCGDGYTAGTTIYVVAIANPGYSFSHWSGSVSGTSPK